MAVFGYGRFVDGWRGVVMFSSCSGGRGLVGKDAGTVQVCVRRQWRIVFQGCVGTAVGGGGGRSDKWADGQMRGR